MSSLTGRMGVGLAESGEGKGDPNGKTEKKGAKGKKRFVKRGQGQRESFRACQVRGRGTEKDGELCWVIR